MTSRPRPAVSLFLVSLIVLMCASIATAQSDRPSQIDPNDYGTSSSNTLIIPGASFVPTDSTTGYNKPFLFLTRTGGGGAEFTYPLYLPSGALVQTITAYVVDSSAAGNVTLRLCKQFSTPNGATQDLNCDGADGTFVGVSTSGTPGHTTLVGTVNSPFLPFEGGFNKSWVIIVDLGTTDGNTLLHSVKVTWKRQISPDPATATFTDVPVGHPFHRFVEALAASGITGGCGGGNYCPDTPVTRGQMAVFLAGALGLHWAP